MSVSRQVERLALKISANCRKLDEKSVEAFEKALLKARRVFLVGAGRSGLVARAFAMRLMHLGLTVYVVGETTTPAIGKGDLLVAVTGSGSTGSAVAIAKKARELGAGVACITSCPRSPAARQGGIVIKIEGRLPEKSRDYPSRQIAGEHEPLTPLGTLFELSAMIFLDTVVQSLMVRLGKSEKEMKTTHTQLE